MDWLLIGPPATKYSPTYFSSSPVAMFSNIIYYHYTPKMFICWCLLPFIYLYATNDEPISLMLHLNIYYLSPFDHNALFKIIFKYI